MAPRKKAAPADHIVRPDKPVLVLRTTDANGRSYGGFQWPESGAVECPDWDPTPECGDGLHGLLWGAGDGSLLRWDDTAKWLVVEVAEYVDIDGGKVKFPRGTVVFCGDRLGATSYIIANGADPAKCVGGTATAGYGGTATAGYRGTATAGDRGTILLRWWDSRADRFRTATGYVGEDGIEPKVAYRLDGTRFVKAEPQKEAA